MATQRMNAVTPIALRAASTEITDVKDKRNSISIRLYPNARLLILQSRPCILFMSLRNPWIE